MPKRIATGELDEAGRPVMKTVRKRARRLNLAKIGLSTDKMKSDKKRKKLREIRGRVKDRALKLEVIEEK